MKEQIIQLEPHDDINSVRDRLGWIRAPRVLLVFPPHQRHPILRDRLDLVLLQREATRRHAQLALITADPVVIEHANELDIATFRTIEASHKRFWRTARARLSPPEERPTPLDPDLAEAGSRLREQVDRMPVWLQQVTTAIVFGITLAALLTGAYVILPGARIDLVPAGNQVTVTTTITADPGQEAGFVDPDASLIAGRRVGVEVEGSTTVDATGTLLEPSQKARGIALFTNLIPDQLTIPEGTIVRTTQAQPVRFVTLEDATLPGQIGETVSVTVEALEPGFEGNLPSNRINEVEGPLASRVGVTNPEPTNGGYADEVPAVAEDDLTRARALLLQQLQQRAFAEIETGLIDEMEFVPIESLNVALIHAETYSAYVGEAQERVTLTMRVTIQGTAVDERLARQVVYAELADKVGSGYQIGSGSLVFRPGEVAGVDEEGRVAFVMQAAGDVTADIEEDAVRELVKGISTAEAIRRLNRELLLASPPTVTPWPAFWPMMPVLPMRIDVQIEGAG